MAQHGGPAVAAGLQALDSPAERTGARGDAKPRTATLLAAGSTLATLLVAWAVIGTGPPPLSFDAYATTLHFERIVAGHHLEVDLGTTPKPLLTLLFGLAHGLGGWSLLAAFSILAWAASAGTAALLGTRLGGPLAGAVAGLAVAGSPTLALEAALGLGTVWALPLWLAAGLAATGDRPRWRLAGALLGLATLARPETLLVTGSWLALVALRRIGGRRNPRGIAVGTVLALWCLPVMVLHDWLLTGDGLYWVEVSGEYGTALAALGALPSPLDAARMVGSVLLEAPARTVLAAIGIALLARRRSWPALAGLVVLGPGVAVALPALALSGRFADPRYLEPIRAAVALAACVGLGLALPALRRWIGQTRAELLRARRGRIAVAALAAAAGAALLAWPTPGPLAPGLGGVVARFRSFSQSAEAGLPALQHVLADEPGALAWPGTTRVGGRQRLDLFAVPGNIRPRLALDLGAPLTRLVPLDPSRIDIDAGVPPAGEIVLHSAGDAPPAAFQVFEVPGPKSLGAVVLIPLYADASTWVVRLDVPGASPLSAPSQR